jgi:hypothetical protein
VRSCCSHRTGAVTDNADFDIEEVLAAGKQRTAELTVKLKEMAGASMVSNFSMDSSSGGSRGKKEAEEEEEESQGPESSRSRGFFIDIGQRERKSRFKAFAGGYNIDQAYREQLGAAEAEEEEEEQQKPQAGRRAGSPKGGKGEEGRKGDTRGPADLLLERLVAQERARRLAAASAAASAPDAAAEEQEASKRRGGRPPKSEKQSETFYFREGEDNYYAGSYDADGMIVGETSLDTEEVYIVYYVDTHILYIIVICFNVYNG